MVEMSVTYPLLVCHLGRVLFVVRILHFTRLFHSMSRPVCPSMNLVCVCACACVRACMHVE